MKRGLAIMNSNSSSVRWAFNASSWNPSQEQILLATSCIQKEEKERIGRFVFCKDAKSSLIGRLLMRKFIFDYSDNAYSSILFDRDKKGKPVLKNAELQKTALNFNVSHQGNYTILAGEVSNAKVGVDVMKIEYSGGRSLSEFFRLMTRHFSPEEWDTIKFSYAADKKKLAMFCRHWCLKESFVKATGTGITTDLQKISFKISTLDLAVGVITNDTRVIVEGKELTDWCFEEMLLDAEHCVAVALNGSSKELVHHETHAFQMLSFDDLMKGCEPLLPSDPLYSSSFLKKE